MINETQIKQLGGNFKKTQYINCVYIKIHVLTATACMSGVYSGSQVIRQSFGEKLAVQLSSQDSSVSNFGH